MSITLDDLHYFTTPEGRSLLQAARECPGDDLARLTRLRKRFPAERCRAAVTLLVLRERAGTKFSRATNMVFDRDGLEQASGETIAAHCAERYRGLGRIADLCCGIGGNTVALAGVSEVLAVDQNPLRVSITRWNAGVYDVRNRVKGICADVSVWLPPADAIFMDPSRREGNRRFLSPSDYRPPVRLKQLFDITSHVGIKVAPGLSYDDIPPGCEVEFISESGACKEAVFWFGDLQTDAIRRATVLPSGATLAFQLTPEAPVHPPGAFLYEPDRAVIRAHLIDQIAGHLNAWKLDPEVAYLSADHPTNTPFARCFEVIDVIPYSLKRLQKYLTAHNIGRLDIKKRHFPIPPEALRKRLKLKGNGWLTLFLTRIRNRPTAIVSKPKATGGGNQKSEIDK